MYVLNRFKDAKELRNTDKYDIEYHADQNVATLTIRKTEHMDAGRYRLEAHNINGDVETACRLNVSGRLLTPSNLRHLGGALLEFSYLLFTVIHCSGKGTHTIW